MNRYSRDSILSALTLTFLIVLVSGCGAPAEEPTPPAPAPEPEVVRTANPEARGLSVSDFPRVKELAPNVYSYEQLRAAGDESFTTVSMFVVTDEGVLVADGQGSGEETRRMIDEIAKITDQPITHVVVCSDHGDHTSGNSEFPSEATFYASSTSKATLERSANNPNRRGRGDAPPPAIVVPTETVDDQLTLTMGGTEIQIHFLGRAHTGGDLHVYMPQERILFMSESFLNRVFPAMRSAYPSEWVQVIDRAENMDVDTYIPGHGFVEEPDVSREELAEYRLAVEAVIAEATRLHESGLTADEAVEQADWGEYASWTLAGGQGPTALRKVYAELNGELQQ